MIEATGSLAPKDYVNAQYLHIRPRLPFKILGAMILIAAIWAIWYSFVRDSSESLSWADFAAPVGLIYLLLAFFVYLPWKTKRTYNQQKSLQRQVRMHFSDAGLQAESETGRASVPWSDYLKWKENAHLFLLYVSDPVFHMVPKRFFQDPTDIERFRKLLLTKIGRTAA